MVDCGKEANTRFSCFAAESRSPDEIVYSLCESYLAQIPKPLNLEDVVNKYPTDYNQCMNTVLTQEVTRYNVVLNAIHQSCKEMLRAINGFVVMSSEMDRTFESIFNNQVPDAWQANSYPNLKPLALWVADLLERMKFIQKW